MKFCNTWRKIYMFHLLLSSAAPVADWISSTFPIIQTVLIIAIALLAILIIVSVLVIPSKPQNGHNVILGTNNESYYGSNKKQSKEGRLVRQIVYSGVSILILTILYFISFGIYSG